jgi:trk system potassium uptake protein TrkH
VNYRLILNQLGLLLIVLGAVLAAIAFWDLIYAWYDHSGEKTALLSVAAASAVGFIIGGLVWWRTSPTSQQIGRKEALLLVAMTWFLGAALSGLPFFIWAWADPTSPPDHPFRNPVNCYFEAMSGLTTTGATILSEIASLPRSLLLWRSFTHWLGGLGIVVLFVAVLPSLGVGGKKLYRVEAPGPTPEGVRPHIRETARVLWLIYLGLTIIQVLALRLAGMNWFDSICHTFGTLATGGFSPRNASVGEFNSGLIDFIIIFFMVLAGGNFGLYHQITIGKWRTALKDPEFKFYLLILFVGSAIVAMSLVNQPIVMTTGERIEPSVWHAVREGTFTAVSIQTTTGFCTSDFHLWPSIAKSVLVILMFIGGCAGSTAGGIKVIRLWIAAKVMMAELERAFRPNVIRPIRVGTTSIDNDLKMATLAYVLGIAVLIAAGTTSVMILEPEESKISFATASTACLATLCTIGPGLEEVGAVKNYGWFSDPSKIVLILLMAMGRLEVFAVLVLFLPHFWRRN